MRLYEMFMGPLDREKPWTDEGIQGVYRFLRRAWALFVAEDGALTAKIVDSGGDEAMVKMLHRTIKAVTHDIENLLFNTAISRLMEFVNAAYKVDAVDRAVVEQFVLLLSPFAPHLCEEIWERLGHRETLAYEPWPVHDESLLVEQTIEIPVQVSGKVRGVITVAADAGKDAVLEAAQTDPKVKSHIGDKKVVKAIYVPDRMVNLVVK